MGEACFLDNSQLAVAIADAHLKGYIEFQGEDRTRLTEKGIDYALAVRNKMEDIEVLALIMMWWTCCDAVEEEANQ